MTKTVLAELEIDSRPAGKRAPRPAADESRAPEPVAGGRDYFVEKDGLRFAGTHLLLELWGARLVDDVEAIERALCGAAVAAGATILHVHLHRFSPSNGVSGVVVLAESHISIHTWPERAFVAIDIFMCGECDPYRAIPILRRAFRPASIELSEHRRGLRP